MLGGGRYSNVVVMSDCAVFSKKDREDRKAERKAKEAAKEAASDLDKAAGLGDTEEEQDATWLEEQLQNQIKEEAAFEAAMEKIREANEQGRSVFETLLSIANDNGINTTDFLTACGFKSPDELRGNKEVEASLAAYMIARGDFEKVETSDESGNTLFTNGEQAKRSSEVIGASSSIWAYIQDYDMVNVMNSPYYVDRNGKVGELDDISNLMMESMYSSGNIDDDEYKNLKRVNEALWNSSIYSEHAKETAINTFPPIQYTSDKQKKERQDFNGYAICDYLMFDKDLKDHIWCGENGGFDVEIDENGFQIRGTNGENLQKIETTDALAQLYIAWMSAHGYTMEGDKRVNASGLSIYDEDGNRLNVEDWYVIDELMKIDAKLKEKRPEYAEYAENHTIAECAYRLFEDEIVSRVGEILEVEAETKTILDELLMPIATVAQTNLAILFGKLDLEESFIDGAGTILPNGASKLAYYLGFYYSLISSGSSLIIDGDFSTGWKNSREDVKGIVKGIQDGKNNFVSATWSEELKNWLYHTNFGEFLDGSAIYSHDTKKFKKVQEFTETAQKNLMLGVAGFVFGGGKEGTLAKSILNAAFTLGEKEEEYLKEIKHLVEEYNKYHGTNLNWNEFVSVPTDLAAYTNAVGGAAQKLIEGVVKPESIWGEIAARTVTGTVTSELSNITNLVFKGHLSSQDSQYSQDFLDWVEEEGYSLKSKWDGVTVGEIVDTTIEGALSLTADKMGDKDNPYGKLKNVSDDLAEGVEDNSNEVVSEIVKMFLGEKADIDLTEQFTETVNKILPKFGDQLFGE